MASEEIDLGSGHYLWEGGGGGGGGGAQKKFVLQAKV